MVERIMCADNLTPLETIILVCLFPLVCFRRDEIQNGAKKENTLFSAANLDKKKKKDRYMMLLFFIHNRKHIKVASSYVDQAYSKNAYLLCSGEADFIKERKKQSRTSQEEKTLGYRPQ